jgi:hypothetical protein
MTDVERNLVNRMNLNCNENKLMMLKLRKRIIFIIII